MAPFLCCRCFSYLSSSSGCCCYSYWCCSLITNTLSVVFSCIYCRQWIGYSSSFLLHQSCHCRYLSCFCVVALLLLLPIQRMKTRQESNQTSVPPLHYHYLSFVLVLYYYSFFDPFCGVISNHAWRWHARTTTITTILPRCWCSSSFLIVVTIDWLVVLLSILLLLFSPLFCQSLLHYNNITCCGIYCRWCISSETSS